MIAMTDIEITIEKIKKAVRLANKTDEQGERETALRLARRLAESKGIAFDEVIVEAQEVKAKKVEDEERQAWHGSISGWAIITLRQHFGVVVMTYKRRIDKGRKARFVWFGSPLNIDIAKYCYDILVRESEKAWRKVSALKMGLKKEQFVRGWFYAIDRKLTEHPLRNDAEQFEAERKEAERKYEEFKQGQEVSEKKMRKTQDDGASIALGYNYGKQVSLNRPCGTSAGTHTEIDERKLLAEVG